MMRVAETLAKEKISSFLLDSTRDAETRQCLVKIHEIIRRLL